MLDEVRRRRERGVVYAPEKAQRPQENFFRQSTLAALRELALRQTAHGVEHRTRLTRESNAGFSS